MINSLRAEYQPDTRRPLSEPLYVMEAVRLFGGGEVSDYLKIPHTLTTFGQTILLKLDEWQNRQKRRFPEYQFSLTNGYLGSIWQTVAHEKLSKHPQAIDASSAFVALTFGLDDFWDKPDFDSKSLKHLNDREFFSLMLKSLEINGIGGQEIFGHLISTLAVDFPEKAGGNTRQELVEDIVSYYLNWTNRHRNGNFNRPWNFKDALEMRKKVSGDCGKIIGKIFSYGTGTYSEEAIRVIQIVGMAGQFQDDLWDLISDIPNIPMGNTHNLFLLLSRENYPEEYSHLIKLLATEKFQGKILARPREVLQATPKTWKMYLDRLVSETEELSSGISNKDLDHVIGRATAEFEPQYRIVRGSPEKYVHTKVKPERVSVRSHTLPYRHRLIS